MPSINWIRRQALVITLTLYALAYTPTQAPEGFSLEGFQNLLGSAYPITYLKNTSESATTILIEYTFKKTNEYQHYIIEIEFVPPGSLEIEPESLSHANNSHQHTARFSDIGYKSQYTFLGAGPGGSGEKLIFTSSNRHYDVKIISSHLLPVSVTAPTLTLETLAAYIDKTLTNIQYIKE